MIVPRRISKIRNQKLHFKTEIEKRKMQKFVLLIFSFLPSGDGGFEIEDVLRKETEISAK